jgi:hypothetical protein
MKALIILLTVAASSTGFFAAYLWLQASKVSIIPEWGPIEPGDERYAHMGITAGIMKAFSESADLNKKAARLTAAAVFLGGFASLVGLLA